MLELKEYRLPQVYVVTSWDDADLKTRKLVHLLEKYNLEATFFVPYAPKGIKRISDDELKTLAQRFEIGSHSVSHSILTQLSRKQIECEVRESKRMLEKIVEKRITCFCYPGGFYDDVVIEEVKCAGYIAARTTEIYTNRIFLSPLKIGTTLQARRQTKFTRSLLNLLKLGTPLSITKMWFDKWSAFAIFLFEVTTSKGGVYHLWGHAWEIEKQKMWKDLEDVFCHIAGRSNVNYCTLGEYVQKILSWKQKASISGG